MQACVSLGWVICLDESISVWTNMWTTCPAGWIMFVPQKHHPMGNEYHSICCDLNGILYAIELVMQGSKYYWPSQSLDEKYSENGKAIGLLMRLIKSIHHSGRVVIVESGFCVLKGLVHLASAGIYASAVTKKYRYWPKYIDSAAMHRLTFWFERNRPHR